MTKTLRALKIDAVNHTITEYAYTGLASMQEAVGGYITTAHRLPNGDEIFVNDEGIYESPYYWFTVKSAHQPFAGNGIIVGNADENGDTTAAKSTIAELINNIRFVVRIPALKQA